MNRAPATFVIALAAVLALAFARAQSPGVPGGGGGGGVSASYVDAQIATVMAAMPQPATTVPPTDSTSGAVGTDTTTYMLANAVRPARYRSSTCTITGGAGGCTMVWSTAFGATPNALGDPSALNTSPATTQYNCNWTALTTTQGTVVCRSSVLGLALLGTILSYLNNGVVVTGNAIQPL